MEPLATLSLIEVSLLGSTPVALHSVMARGISPQPMALGREGDRLKVRTRRKFKQRLTGSGWRSDVLKHINDKWEIMATEECIPVHVALQLMDHSSLGRGRDYPDFQRTSRHLQKALRSIVNGTLPRAPCDGHWLNQCRTSSRL